MRAFQDRWFCDWLTVTVPNGTTGKGRRSEGPAGQSELEEATGRLMTWATLSGLRMQRVGRGGDGYAGGASFAMQPTDSETLAVVRVGHATNMPGLELRGGGGSCADLAPRALAELGPLLIARADVSMDLSQQGMFEQLEELARQTARANAMNPPRMDGTPETGRTLYLGKGETTLRIYEKGFEMAAKGKIAPEDIDPHLVRIEYTFRPRKGAKAGFARTARDEGVGALLGAVHWVRRMVEQIAVISGDAEDDTAKMAVTRVARTPDPRPAEVRAEHGIQQYAGTFASATIARIVEYEHDGDWLSAVIDPDRITADTLEFLRPYIHAQAERQADRCGVLAVRDAEAEAKRAEEMLVAWMKQQKLETDAATTALAAAEAASRARAGIMAVAA